MRLGNWENDAFDDSQLIFVGEYFDGLGLFVVAIRWDIIEPNYPQIASIWLLACRYVSFFRQNMDALNGFSIV